MEMAKRQPQTNNEGCLIKTNLIWLPHVMLFHLISLLDGDIVGDLKTGSESVKNLILHAHWKVINWPDSRKDNFSITTSRRTGFPLPLRGWICWQLPLRTGPVIWHILVPWWVGFIVPRFQMDQQWMFTHRFTTSWHSLTYKWQMETKILLTQLLNIELMTINQNKK